MKKTIIFTLILLNFKVGYTQSINIHSVSTARQPSGDKGYTLDGIHMSTSRLKLLDASNFDKNGTYPKKVVITDNYSNSNSLCVLSDKSDIDLFFFGSFVTNSSGFVPFSYSEIDSLYNWSLRGGKLIITGQPNSLEQNYTILNYKWGYDLNYKYPSNFIPTTYGQTSTIFDGPFGVVATANQGASSQGYISKLPTNSIILAENSEGNPTLVLDCKTLDLIIADTDAFTELGGITGGSQINSDQDRFWVNTIAYMDQMESPPKITVDGRILSTGNYASYQWFLNNEIIPNATSSSYVANQDGNYSLEIKYFNGCVVRTNPFAYEIPNIACVPSIFSPNGDGNNDTLFVRGFKISQLYFIVYNRWGEKVFESTDKQFGWDGTFNGSQLIPDVFVYYAKITFLNNEIQEKKGNVTLVR